MVSIFFLTIKCFETRYCTCKVKSKIFSLLFCVTDRLFCKVCKYYFKDLASLLSAITSVVFVIQTFVAKLPWPVNYPFSSRSSPRWSSSVWTGWYCKKKFYSPCMWRAEPLNEIACALKMSKNLFNISLSQHYPGELFTTVGTIASLIT